MMNINLSIWYKRIYKGQTIWIVSLRANNLLGMKFDIAAIEGKAQVQ